jgi:hypothetical protein
LFYFQFRYVVLLDGNQPGPSGLDRAAADPEWPVSGNNLDYV